MKRVWWTICVLMALFLGGVVWAMRNQPAHNDFTEDVTNLASASTAVQSGDGWQLVSYPGEDCFRVQVGGSATTCYSQHMGDGSIGVMELKGAGHHFALAVIGSTQPLHARFFSSARHAEAATLVAVGGNQLLVTELGSHERPWGAQIVDESGATVYTVSWTT